MFFLVNVHAFPWAHNKGKTNVTFCFIERVITYNHSSSVLFWTQYAPTVKDKLYADVEGTCSGRYGYIITVVSLSSFGKGKILPGSGLSEFKVSYQAIVFKPYKNEVLDGIVTTVNKMGFFADVGPLQVFVSNHLIPNDMKFDANGNPPCYSSEDQVIQKDVQVRLKIVGTRIDATEIFAIGTIKEDYLGVISP